MLSHWSDIFQPSDICNFSEAIYQTTFYAWNYTFNIGLSLRAQFSSFNVTAFKWIFWDAFLNSWIKVAIFYYNVSISCSLFEAELNIVLINPYNLHRLNDPWAFKHLLRRKLVSQNRPNSLIFLLLHPQSQSGLVWISNSRENRLVTCMKCLVWCFKYPMCSVISNFLVTIHWLKYCI